MENKTRRELEKLWEIFLFKNIRIPASKEKVEALEEYLTCFLNCLWDHEFVPRQEFRDPIGAAGILTRCFLDDMVRLCQSSTPETQQAVLQYLFVGRGSRLMRVLEDIGVGGITCNFDLTELLLSLLPYLRSQEVVGGVTINGSNRLRTGSNDDTNTGDCYSSFSMDPSTDEKCSLAKMRFSEPTEIEDRNISSLPSSTNALDSIFKLLQQLCEADVEDCSLMPFSNNASSTVLTALIDQLLTFDNDDIQQDVSLSHSYITQKMVSLIINIGTSLLKYKEPLNKLPRIASSLYQFLRHILKKIVRVRAAGSNKQYETLLDELMCCTLGIVNIVHSASNVRDNNISYKEFIQIFNLFFNHDDCDILQSSICYLLNRSQEASRSEKLLRLLSWLGQMGMNIKKLRLEARQLNMKNRSPTKKWRLDITSHHHYSLPNDATDCPIDTITNLLMSLVSKNNEIDDEVINSNVLNALSKCGICCCVNLRSIYTIMFENLSGISRNLQEQRLRFVEYSVISLSGSQVLFERMVVTCESCQVRTNNCMTALEEVYYSLNSSKELNSINSYSSFYNGFWMVFEKYSEIITTSASPSLILLMEKHLLSIVSGVRNTTVQLELFLRSILPLLISHSSSDQNDSDVSILRSMLNIVLAFADVSEINRTLHVVKIMENLYHVMCSPKLRDVVLRLLHTLALVNWINSIDIFLIETGKDEFGKRNVEDMKAMLNIYHVILVQHTVRYQSLIPELHPSEDTVNLKTKFCGSCVVTYYEHFENDDQLLPCLRDLWKTMSCIADKCVEHRQWLWEKSLKHLISDFTIALARRLWCYDDEYQSNEIEWEILGVLIHLIVTCEVLDENMTSESTELSFIERLQSIFILFPKNCSFFYRNIDRLLRMLTSASMETNRNTLEYSKISSIRSERITEPSENLIGSEAEAGSVDSSSTGHYLSSNECDYDADVEDNDIFLQRGEFAMAKLYKAEPHLETATKITSPAIINLALQLAIEYKMKLTAENNLSRHILLVPLENMIQTLCFISKSSNFNCHVLLQKCKITKFILKNFYEILVTSDYESHSALQNHLLETLSSSLRYTMLDWELKSVLKLFIKNPSLSPKLLPALASILNTVKTEPPYNVSFLHTKSNEAAKSLDLEVVHGAKSSAESDFIVNSVVKHREIHSAHSSLAIASLAGYFPSLVNNDNLPFNDCGLGVSLWLLLPENKSFGALENQVRKVHLFTFGHDRLAIEFWAHLDTRLLILKLVNWSQDNHYILDTKLSNNQLTNKGWQHLFINWVSFRKSGNLVVSVNVCENAVSGKPPEKFTLECEWSKTFRNNRHWYLFLGHSGVQDNDGLAWRLGQLKVFSGPFVNNEAAILLHKLGPGNTQLHILQSGVVDKQRVVSNAQPLDNNLLNLRKRLILSFLPQNATVFIWHKGHSNEQQRLSDAPTEVFITAVKLGKLKSSRSSSLHVALTRIGGAPIFISLFGLIVVNHSDDEQLQASCLQLITDLLKRDIKIERHFLDCAGWELLLWVMATSKCKISCEMLGILLQNCISEPILICSSAEQKWIINKVPTATVANAKLLKLLLHNWKLWNNESVEILHLLLKCCVFLVDSSNLKRDLNLKIFMEFNIFECIMDILRERSFGGDQKTLSATSCRCIVRLLEILSGKKITISYLSKLVDCLIAIHPFDLTFICHARSSFYFLLGNVTTKDSDAPPSITEASSLKNNKRVANENLKRTSDFASALSNSDPENSSKSTNSSRPRDLNSMVDQNEQDEARERNLPSTSGFHLREKREVADSVSSTSSESLIPLATESKEAANNQKYFYTDIGIISKGIINIIGNAMREADQPFFNNISKIIDYRLLIVLALHPYEDVRVEIVKTLKTYLTMLSGDRSMNLAKKQHLLIALGNQLFQYKTEIALVEACMEFILGDTFSFQSSSKFLPPNRHFEQTCAIPLILSVLPRIGPNVSLCVNLISVLNNFCSHQPDLYFAFLDFGLVQSVCLTISSIVKNIISAEGNKDDFKKNPALRSINEFMATAIYHYLWYGNVNQFTKLPELLYIISHFEKLHLHRYGVDVYAHLAFRNCQCDCLITALVTLLTHFEWNEDAIEFCCKDKYLMKITGKSHPLPPKIPSDLDLQNRLGVVLCCTVKFLLDADIESEDKIIVFKKEEWFCRFLLHILFEGLLASLIPTQWSFQMPWNSLLHSMRSCLYHHLQLLIVFSFSPKHSVTQRMKIIDHLISTRNHLDTLLCILKDDVEIRRQILAYLDLLLNEQVDFLTNEEITRCLSLHVELQKDFNYSLSYVVEMSRGLKNIAKWVCSTLNMPKLMGKHEDQFNEVVRIADKTLTIVSKKQDSQRKRFHDFMKVKFSVRLYIRQKWQSLVNRLTHERAIWHLQESYSSSWQLDSTEGPQRVRKRLKRCTLIMEERFLLPVARDKLRFASCVHPLAHLFDDENVCDDRAVISNNIQTKEKINFTSSCSIITPATESRGELLFVDDCIYYIGEEKNHLNDPQPSTKNDVICHAWKFNEITEIHKRRYQLQDNALELFLSYGQTYLLAFNSTQERNAIYDRLLVSDLPNLVPENNNLDIHTMMWRDGAITNFEYLTQLNKFAGRSFNDLMQYPVFPFTLADYLSPVLDLKSGETFRNLAKPMAIQKKDKESHYLNQYNFLQKEHEESDSSLSPAIGPYHYGSHYSNSGIVLHFLVRLPPFTNMFLQYQDNNFDIPDRTFHSVHTSWRLASSDSTTDVKELIPEFYFLPEMFMNFEGFNFGVRQSGDEVSDVEIPQWARENPRLFTLIHRQALEAPYVRENLHHWIDLVFGYKQTGKAAIEAMNVFHPATYYGFDINQMKDPVRLDAMRTMIRTFGQTPVQLFRRSHPLVSLALGQQSQPSCDMRVMDEVVGLSWGSYVGSPSESEPIEVSRKNYQQPITSFFSVVTNEVFGLASKTALFVQYCKVKGVSMINTAYIANAALIRWGLHDGLIWIQQRRDHVAQPFAAIDVANPVTSCATSPDCKLVFFGRSSGNIVVYHTSFESVTGGSQTKVRWSKITHLYGHDAKVVDINLCPEFSIAVSASEDESCIIWDLNKLKYIRCIDDHKFGVKLVSVSKTSGDIASVSHLPDGGSNLKLHTVNAMLIGNVTTREKIHAICFSCAPEGVSVNSICAGLANGTIMMWSSWDLIPTRRLTIPRYTQPIVCLTYSVDCQHLYVANEDGVLIILESSSFSSTVPKFRTIM